MLHCKEIGRLVASGELGEAGWLKRLEVRLHFLMCRHCFRYADQIRRLGQAVKSLWSGPPSEEELHSAHRVKEKLWAELISDPPTARGDDS
jgi:hypothetical protein